MHVCVLGGGINGICCAVRILEHYRNQQKPIEVTLVSDKFSPYTTGDGSGGLWSPYVLGNTQSSKVHKWSKSTHRFFEELWLSEDAGEAGVCLVPVVRVTTRDNPLNIFWKDVVYGCVSMSDRRLSDYSAKRVKKFTSGLQFISYTAEPKLLIPYLTKRFRKQGGMIVNQKIENLQEFLETSSYDAVINCTGLGSKDLLKDEEMYPVRGQVSRVKAPWIYYVILDESDDGNYIIPNCECVVLGGTHQKSYDTTVSSVDKKFIVDGCREMEPSLHHAHHLFDWVGLRPGRTTLRLEHEEIEGNKILIQNYGHGGSGVTLSWGCAENVIEILDKCLQQKRNTLSKL